MRQFDIYKTTEDNKYIAVYNQGKSDEKRFNIVQAEDKTFWLINEDLKASGKLRSDATLNTELIGYANELWDKTERTIVDYINGFPVYVDKASYKLMIDINWEILELNESVTETIKKSFSELKKVKIASSSSGNPYITLGDRVLMFGPTGTGKTYTFLETAQKLISEWKLDTSLVVTISEWFDDMDFLAYLAPDKTGTITYKEKAVVSLLRDASKWMKVAICFDELNRWNKSFHNLILKLLDSVNGSYYEIYNHFNDEVIQIPIENVMFFATMNLGGKYVWTNALDEALFDRFNIVQYQTYNEAVEKELYKEFGEHAAKAEAIVTHSRKMNLSGEIRAPISTRWIKAWAEKYINSPKTPQEFVETFGLCLLNRLCSVDDFGNPNKDEQLLVMSKFKELWFNI